MVEWVGLLEALAISPVRSGSRVLRCYIGGTNSFECPLPDLSEKCASSITCSWAIPPSPPPSPIPAPPPPLSPGECFYPSPVSCGKNVDELECLRSWKVIAFSISNAYRICKWKDGRCKAGDHIGDNPPEPLCLPSPPPPSPPPSLPPSPSPPPQLRHPRRRPRHHRPRPRRHRRPSRRPHSRRPTPQTWHRCHHRPCRLLLRHRGGLY